ncbi:MAG: twin-arginine translocase TatA/TatE family subunit [Planctomycetota bacterium]
MFGISTTELMILLAVVALLFGSARLPSLMRNLGRSAIEFKKGMRDDDSESPSETTKSS